jgi:hypothetical protein
MNSVRRGAWGLVTVAVAFGAVIYRPPLLLVIGVLLALLLVLYLLPPLFVPATATLGKAERIKAESDARGVLISALGAAALVISLYLTTLSLKDARESTNRSLDVTREGQLADRFARAVTQLGDPSLDVRTSAIYALGQIARSTKNLLNDEMRDDRLMVTDILVNYLHEHGRWFTAGMPPSSSSDAVVSRPLGTEVQAALTVLTRLDRDSERRLELPGIDLGGVDLRDAHFENADLYGAKFSKALLNNAHFDRAILYNADFTKAILAGTDLTEAVLVGADLTGAILNYAKLTRTNLTEAVLIGTELTGSDLDHADLSGVRGITPDQLGGTKGKPSALPNLDH